MSDHGAGQKTDTVPLPPPATGMKDPLDISVTSAYNHSVHDVCRMIEHESAGAHMGSYRSGQTGLTVNQLADAFGGSNPPLPTPDRPSLQCASSAPYA